MSTIRRGQQLPGTASPPPVAPVTSIGEARERYDSAVIPVGVDDTGNIVEWRLKRVAQCLVVGNGNAEVSAAMVASAAAQGVRVVVIDPGFFSVDWVALEAGEIRYSSSGTSLQAMSVLLETIDKLISEDHGAKVGMDRLEKAMRTGDLQVLLFGEKVDISPYLNAAMKKVAPVALTAMRQSMRDESINADLVLIAGGGALAYKEAAKEIFSRSKIIVPEQSVLANVRGFWFYGA